MSFMSNRSNQEWESKISGLQQVLTIKSNTWKTTEVTLTIAQHQLALADEYNSLCKQEMEKMKE